MLEVEFKVRALLTVFSFSRTLKLCAEPDWRQIDALVRRRAGRVGHQRPRGAGASVWEQGQVKFIRQEFKDVMLIY